MNRDQFLTIVEAALAAGRSRYAREAALRLLAAWPGDLSGLMALARAHASGAEPMQAIDTLETIVAIDPEHSDAQRALGELFTSAGRGEHAAEAYAAAHVVDGRGLPPGLRPPPWAEPARGAMLALQRRDWPAALAQAQRAMESAASTPLPSLLYLLAVWQDTGQSNSHAYDLARPLAEGFHARWPGCVAFSLCLAESLLAGQHDTARAITLLHEAGALDPAGEVAARYWGTAHPYRALWPHAPNPDLPGPLPEDVSQMLGLNRLAGRPVTDQLPDGPAAAGDAVTIVSNQHQLPSTRRQTHAGAAQAPATLADIRAELDRLAAHLARHKAGSVPKSQSTASGRPSPIPAHLIFTSKTRLIQKYGAEAASAIGDQLSELATASARSSGVRTLVVYVDDRDSLRPYALRPANPENAWEIKLLLRDLALALEKQGERLASVLIAGGDEVVPFHRLPNPVDDADGDVPSDNPYATLDENFLIPEWAIGRLPTAAGKDPASFVRTINATIAAHRAARPRRRSGRRKSEPGIVSRFVRWLLWAPVRMGLLPARQIGFGYAARAWHQASAAVFAAIGDLRYLNTCPPLDVSRLPSEGLALSPLSYFNLHGVEDGPEWYGQRAADDPRSPQYPIALRPRDVVNSGRAPALVFTEACYGANIVDKTVDDALCLKFLDAGSRGVIGSTKIAYGSIGSPLIGADLLSRLFWDALKEGWPMGEGLRRAKLAHAAEMHKRQGFLDGEDQKTLISFVFYGDPLLDAPPADPRMSSPLSRRSLPAARPADLTLCADEAAADLGFSRPETVSQIRSLVARHLPGMEECDLRIARQYRFPASAALRGLTPPARASAKTLGPETGNLVFTLSKTVRADAGSEPHPQISQFVRVTVDQTGKVLKLAFSR